MGDTGDPPPEAPINTAHPFSGAPPAPKGDPFKLAGTLRNDPRGVVVRCHGWSWLSSVDRCGGVVRLNFVVDQPLTVSEQTSNATPPAHSYARPPAPPPTTSHTPPRLPLQRGADPVAGCGSGRRSRSACGGGRRRGRRRGGRRRGGRRQQRRGGGPEEPDQGVRANRSLAH